MQKEKNSTIVASNNGVPAAVVNIEKSGDLSEYAKLSDFTKNMLGLVNLVTFAYPIVAMTYSKMIYDCKFMTKPRTRESRISPNVS